MTNWLLEVPVVPVVYSYLICTEQRTQHCGVLGHSHVGVRELKLVISVKLLLGQFFFIFRENLTVKFASNQIFFSAKTFPSRPLNFVQRG